MVNLLKLARIAAVFTIIACAGAAFARGHSGRDASTPDQDEIVQAVRTMFVAATTDDLKLFHTVAAPDFYAFDGGKRYDGDALMDLVKGLHAAGSVYVWTVNEPEVHISCNTAWVTYVNRGSVQNASGTTKVTWLESVILEKEAGRWRVRFASSARAPQ